MKVLTWNINAIHGAGERFETILDAIGDSESDIVLLQEAGFRRDFPDELHAELQQRGFVGVFYSGPADHNGKPYSNIIASRWPVEGDEG